MGKGEEGGGGMDQAPMNGNGAVARPRRPVIRLGGTDIAQLAARLAALEEQVQARWATPRTRKKSNWKTDTQDARRFKMRRRDAMRMHDEGSEVPAPERLDEEMVARPNCPAGRLPAGQQGQHGRRSPQPCPLRSHPRQHGAGRPSWGDLIANAEIIAPGTKRHRCPLADEIHG